MLVVATTVVGGIAFSQSEAVRREALVGAAARLGATALIQPGIDRELLLAAAAYGIDSSFDTRGSMLAALLRSAEVPWEASVEANGWELMLSFVAMGAGVAVVNACCRMPAGVVRIALPELPVLRYHCFHLRGLPKATPAGQLRVALQEHGNAWRSPP